LEEREVEAVAIEQLPQTPGITPEVAMVVELFIWQHGASQFQGQLVPMEKRVPTGLEFPIFKVTAQLEVEELEGVYLQGLRMFLSATVFLAWEVWVDHPK